MQKTESIHSPAVTVLATSTKGSVCSCCKFGSFPYSRTWLWPAPFMWGGHFLLHLSCGEGAHVRSQNALAFRCFSLLGSLQSLSPLVVFECFKVMLHFLTGGREEKEINIYSCFLYMHSKSPIPFYNFFRRCGAISWRRRREGRGLRRQATRKKILLILTELM